MDPGPPEGEPDQMSKEKHSTYTSSPDHKVLTFPDYCILH